MLYKEYMDKVKDIALLMNEDTGLTYIAPDYEYLLSVSDLKLEDVSDFDGVNKNVVHRHLLLERDMRNAQRDKTPIIMQWIYDVMTTVVEPAIIEQQNELIKNLLEYRKEKNAIDDRTKELDIKQKVLEDKSKVLPITFGMNFAKRKP